VSADGQAHPELKRTLGPIMLWGLGVGYVISGEYFGWNLGLPLGGTWGMLAATLVITLMYVGFVLSYAELACAIPRAGGVFVYATRGLGPRLGALAGLVQLIEFVFAPPAIAMAIGAYVAQRYPEIDPRATAIASYFIFTSLNAWGVRQAAIFELVVTVLAVVELLIFVGVTVPYFEMENLSKNALPNGWSGAFACLPFAIWFYLGIEGVANAAEEARDPQRTVAFGFGASILTLVTLALLVFFTAIGVNGWESIVYADGSTTMSDAPLPLALAHVVGRESALYTLLVGIGLLGLVASFHGIILAAGRATLELGRARLLPSVLGHVHAKTRTPTVALFANMIVGIIAILSGRTSEIITLSAFGAIVLYAIAMASLFALRRREPNLERPFKAVLYPWLPGTTFVIAVVSFVAMTVTNITIALVFFGMVCVGLVAFIVRAEE
jgi:ethanolamine permease